MDAQQFALEAFTAGHEVIGAFSDVASGKLPPDVRPGLSAALEAVRRDKGSALLVSKLDRLSRDVEVIAGLMNRVSLYTVEDGLNADRLTLHIKATIAEQERRMIGERTRVALAAKKAAGVRLGMHSHKDPSSGDRARAASALAVKANADAHARHVAPTLLALKRAGLTLSQIADQMNALQVATPRGGQWYASGVCNMLSRIAEMDLTV
jgi:DNA invertase Pin-like site-specific DNA recombinase